jgi:hypothetical protein
MINMGKFLKCPIIMKYISIYYPYTNNSQSDYNEILNIRMIISMHGDYSSILILQNKSSVIENRVIFIT